ncbi:MAG: tRNA ((34)-2-O)-methyltransferase [Phycisphaerales bacterium]|nr:tRNA ((34)-2-O)-methyltransferase [Phycisphaerales bacterium]
MTSLLTHLRAHHLKVVLVEPRIAPNVGNIARLCVTTGTELHLVRPLGFLLSDAKLKRSAMDYWPRLKLTLHDDVAALETAMARTRLWLCENGEGRSIWQADFADGDALVFGSETAGLPADFIARHAGRLVHIPQAPGERCLNVSTAAGVILMESLRQLHARGTG